LRRTGLGRLDEPVPGRSGRAIPRPGRAALRARSPGAPL